MIELLASTPKLKFSLFTIPPVTQWYWIIALFILVFAVIFVDCDRE